MEWIVALVVALGTLALTQKRAWGRLAPRLGDFSNTITSAFAGAWLAMDMIAQHPGDTERWRTFFMSGALLFFGLLIVVRVLDYMARD